MKNSTQRNNATTQQRNNATTQQRNNATTQQRNNATTQQRNNATTQQRNNATTQLGTGGKQLTVALLLTAALLSLSPIEQSQAQLIIDVYPSQDTPTNTLWIFSGSSSVGFAGTLRTSGNASSADGWQTASDIYNANKPSNAQITLSPLLSSTNSKDIASVRARIPGGGRTDITFAASATNTPTITIGTTPVNRTINRMFMNDQNVADNIGIRVSSSFNYGLLSGQPSSWTGSGLLINKPIGDFFIKNVGIFAGLRANFASGGVTMRIHSAVIPEPEEYALVFGLFALGFVILRRHFQRKQRRQRAATS